MSGDEGDCLAAALKLAPGAGRRKAVVFLHGLAHHPGAMKGAARAMEEEGWAIANLGHPSVKLSLEAHAESASRAALALTEDGADDVCFMGHSLGGLIARSAMARAARDGWKPGRLLVAGSPSEGSVVANFLSELDTYRRVFGPCGQSVTSAGAASVPLPVCSEVGVIAGGNGGRGWNPLLRGDNDGVVRVAETRIPQSETCFMLVRSLHTPLASHPQTVRAAISFFEHGKLSA
jgi:hypothetical protein